MANPMLFMEIFQSTRPVRGGTRLKIDYEKTGYISIHPPRAGRDQLAAIERWPETQFQSTRPVRGGTGSGLARLAPGGNFNPPAPCGAGQALTGMPDRANRFQSTRPVRGGTTDLRKFAHCGTISIHPPRAGRDYPDNHPEARDLDFNPPAPCGAGPVVKASKAKVTDFNPPAPCGAGRRTFESLSSRSWISIHPPRAGRDPQRFRPTAPTGKFQSTRPVRGGTPVAYRLEYPHYYFNPPAPCGAGRGNSDSRCKSSSDFNPPAPCGAGRCPPPLLRQSRNFNPPAPCGAGPYTRAILPSFVNFNPPAPCGAGPDTDNSVRVFC